MKRQIMSLSSMLNNIILYSYNDDELGTTIKFIKPVFDLFLTMKQPKLIVTIDTLSVNYLNTCIYN